MACRRKALAGCVHPDSVAVSAGILSRVQESKSVKLHNYHCTLTPGTHFMGFVKEVGGRVEDMKVNMRRGEKKRFVAAI